MADTSVLEKLTKKPFISCLTGVCESSLALFDGASSGVVIDITPAILADLWRRNAVLTVRDMTTVSGTPTFNVCFPKHADIIEAMKLLTGSDTIAVGSSKLLMVTLIPAAKALTINPSSQSSGLVVKITSTFDRKNPSSAWRTELTKDQFTASQSIAYLSPMAAAAGLVEDIVEDPAETPAGNFAGGHPRNASVTFVMKPNTGTSNTALSGGNIAYGESRLVLFTVINKDSGSEVVNIEFMA